MRIDEWRAASSVFAPAPDDLEACGQVALEAGRPVVVVDVKEGVAVVAPMEMKLLED